VYDNDYKVPLKDLAPADRTGLLDDLIHNAKGDEAATANNADEEAQLAYLLADRHT